MTVDLQVIYVVYSGLDSNGERNQHLVLQGSLKPPKGHLGTFQGLDSGETTKHMHSILDPPGQVVWRTSQVVNLGTGLVTRKHLLEGAGIETILETAIVLWLFHWFITVAYSIHTRLRVPGSDPGFGTPRFDLVECIGFFEHLAHLRDG